MKPILSILAALVLPLGFSACSSPKGGFGSIRFANVEAHRAALATALADADGALSSGPNTSVDQMAYSAATEKVVALWLTLSDETTRSRSTAVGGSYRLQASWPKDLLFVELIPAYNFKRNEQERRITREGAGDPFVAHCRNTAKRDAKEPFVSEAGYVATVTATIEFAGKSRGGRIANLVFNDPRTCVMVRLAGSTRPVAADLSAMGEYVLAMKNGRMSGVGALMRSDRNLNKLGLIALERPAKGQIPVIFVHGLMSRPATWQNVYNELGADPGIQRGLPDLFLSPSLSRSRSFQCSETPRATGGLAQRTGGAGQIHVFPSNGADRPQHGWVG